MNPSPMREQLMTIFRAGLAAADPAAAVHRHLRRDGERLRAGGWEIDLAKIRRVILVGAGKASARMGAAVEEILGDRVGRGWINVKASAPPCAGPCEGSLSPSQGSSPRGKPCEGLNEPSQGFSHPAPQRVPIHEAGHPVPDEAGVAGARRIAELLQQAGPDDLVIFCISGGGSALLPLPAEGLTLADKQRVTQSLLRCGAKIQEINVVRKHLSGIKGGQAARLAAPARVLSLILSDVIGDPLDIIASGPTAPDSSTFAQALEIVSRYGIEKELPPNVLARLRDGAAGRIRETPKPGDPLFDRVENLIIANNAASVAACAECARGLGYAPRILSAATEGEARDVAREQAKLARAMLGEEKGSDTFSAAQKRSQTPFPGPALSAIRAPACLISGGETTVTLRGRGRGGRNQEFALAAAMAIEGAQGIAFLAAGTDGTDGPTDAAGAFADGETLRLAREKGRRAADCLAANDSYRFFDAVGGLVKTGPTGTNVMDLYLWLIAARPRF